MASTLSSLGSQTFRDIGVVVAAIGDIAIPTDTGVDPTVVRLEEPAGFSSAVMRALEEVEASESTYVLLLHDDVSLEPDAVEAMVDAADSDQSIAAVGAKLVDWFRPEVLQEVGASLDRFAIRRSALDSQEIDHGQRDQRADTLFCSDACLLVRMDLFEEVGGLDPGAWPFYEDVDLCWRLRSRGARVVVEPSATVRHAADLSSGRRLLDAMTLKRQAEAGRLRFMIKHYSLLGLVVLLPQLAVSGLVRVLAAGARRELWRARVIVSAWLSTVASLPSIFRARRSTPHAEVSDREMLAMATREAVGEVRGERAEMASRALAAAGRALERTALVARLPVTWAAAAAGLVVVLLVRDVIFGGTFVLGELRALPTLADALSDHFGRVRRDGLDPFGPASLATVGLGLVRSVIGSGALAEKLVLLGPLAAAGLAGVTLGRALGFSRNAGRWLGVAAAVNPVTLLLLRDGSVGVLVAWAICLWLVGSLLSPAELGTGLGMKVRFAARWALAFALLGMLHPQGFVLAAVLGVAVTVARSGDEHQQLRRRVILTGVVGGFVLLAPWSFEWITPRSPLVGRPGWMVVGWNGGLEHASLGASWPLVLWLLLAVTAALFVGFDRLTLILTAIAGLAVAAGAVGAFEHQTMLVASGLCALVVVAVVARRIVEELPSYELGVRQAAVIGGVVACAVVWLGGVAHTLPDGVRLRSAPVVAGVMHEEVGRVLWMSETTGGVRTWTTMSFSDRIGVFPAPSGGQERLVTRSIEAARGGQTHRLGGILALGDISHIVALDASSRRGLSGQADIALQEEQGSSTIYRNDAWRGPAVLLSAPPASPLEPGGLAQVLHDPRAVAVHGWPYGPISLPGLEGEEVGEASVLYLAGGLRGGMGVEGTRGTIAAGGSWFPAAEVAAPAEVNTPGRWWRWMLPLQMAAVLGLVMAWLLAAYIGSPRVAPPAVESTSRGSPSRKAPLAVGLALVGGLVLGWTGVSWGVGTPFLSAAWFCPPIGEGHQQSLAIANPNPSGVPFVVRTSLDAAPMVERRIAGRGRGTLEIDPEQGAVIESFGRRLVVASEVERQGSYDSSLCAESVGEFNVFPDGGRAATRAAERLFERYVIYNPFPNLARASVRFTAPDEVISPPALRSISIEPGSFVVVDPEEQFEPMLDLSATIRVWQGRAVVARRLRTEVQLSWSLPTSEITRGVLPRAHTAEPGFTNLLAVNSSDEPATVEVVGAGETRDIERFEVPPGSRNEFHLALLQSKATDLVTSLTSDRPVALESLVVSDPGDRSTVSLMGPLRAERRWVVPMAEDRELLVTNPGSSSVRVTIDRLGVGGESGEAIDPVTIEPSQVARIPMGDGEFGVEVRSAAGAVVVAVTGPRGSTPGVAI